MTLDEIKFYVVIGGQILNAVASAGLWLYVRYGDRNKEVDGRFAKLADEFDRRADDQDRRLARLEGVVARAPTHDDLGKLYDKVNQNTQDTRELVGKVSEMNNILRLILNRVAEKGMP